MRTIIDTARQIYSAGLCLLPVAEDGSKKPDLATWLEFKTRRPTIAELRAWNFADRHGLGVIAGPVSQHAECWDFDDLDTYLAFVAAADACELGEVVERIRTGYEDETPRGGRRWIVRYPETVAWADTTLAARPLPEDKLQTLIELPTFNILAPSNGRVHPSGKPYVRISGDAVSIASYTLEEREALLTLARSFDERPKRTAYEPRTAETGSGRRPGDLFNERATWPEVIGSYFHSPRTLSTGVTYWWRPGKNPGQGSHAATTNHAGSDLLYVFSSSTTFEAETSYTKFAAYALLEHGGDFSAAAKALWAAGYREADAETPHVTRSSVPEPPWPSPLDQAAYYGLLGKIVRTIEPESESDPVAILLQLLVMLGNVIGRSARFTVEAHTHYLNEFLALVGRTGKARKGTSYGYPEQLVSWLDPLWTKTSGLSSGEGLVFAVRDAVVKDSKGEIVITDPGISDKRLLVFEGELASVLRVMERSGNILADVMKLAWDGRSLNTLTKNSPTRATSPHISLITHITVDELRRYLTRSEMASGWGNRFLIACVKRSKSLPLGGRGIDLQRFQTELDAVWRFAKATEEMEFDPEAEALWCRVYDRLSAERPGLLGSMTARAEAHTRRLACLYALTDCSGAVFVPHLEAALAVSRYVFDSVAHVFGDSTGNPIADAILFAVRAKPSGLTRTELRDLFNRHQPTEVVQRALELLLALQLIEMVSETTGGRPVERWRATSGDRAT